MRRKTYHKRGMQPKRKIIRSIDGRLHPEQADTIVKLYLLDKLTVTDIARQYEVHQKSVTNLLAREWKRMAKGEPDEYTKRRMRYGDALRRLDEDREAGYKDIGKDVGLPGADIKKIALRNGLGR